MSATASHFPETEGPEGYSRLQKILHWAVVGLLLLQYFVFDRMGRMFHTLMDSGVTTWTVTSVAHVVIGVAVLLLVIARLGLRARHGVPDAPQEEPEPFRIAATLAHWGIYGLLVLIPLTGLAAWFGRVGPAAGGHELMTTALYWLVVAHVGAVLVHQFWWKTNLIKRMT
ncbi:cytochrome b [Pseudooceanicola nitratireducens]|jgi:cytochrome b561|uniref:cytochrome b n=1 Tax=Pseudooceanicola nitratireducens TaxID=517719 RepID=UPI003518CD3E